MLHIFVCEDDDAQRKNVVQTIHNTVMMEELDMQLVLDTADPYELLEVVKTSRNTGIYFLDIDLNCDMNGMKLAQQIRKFDPRIYNRSFGIELYDVPVPGRGDGFRTEGQSRRGEGKNQGMSASRMGAPYLADE